MSLIKNLIKESPKKPQSPKKANDNDDDEEELGKKVRPFIKSATDLQRLRLEKLMKDPEKPVIIPEARRQKDYMSAVPTFVRNVMGSSAGAGSGEFHVYRHLRRKEYARQKSIQAKSAREQQDEVYQQKIQDNQRNADEKTAKKRAKRLKKKERAKKVKLLKKESKLGVDDEKPDDDNAGDSSQGEDSNNEEDNAHAVVVDSYEGNKSEEHKCPSDREAESPEEVVSEPSKVEIEKIAEEACPQSTNTVNDNKDEEKDVVNE